MRMKLIPKTLAQKPNCNFIMMKIRLRTKVYIIWIKIRPESKMCSIIIIKVKLKTKLYSVMMKISPKAKLDSVRKEMKSKTKVYSCRKLGLKSQCVVLVGIIWPRTRLCMKLQSDDARVHVLHKTLNVAFRRRRRCLSSLLTQLNVPIAGGLTQKSV